MLPSCGGEERINLRCISFICRLELWGQTNRGPQNIEVLKTAVLLSNKRANNDNPPSWKSTHL